MVLATAPFILEQKVVNQLVEVSKGEKDYLLKSGCKWHKDIFASTTRRHYYAKEHPWILKRLQEFQSRGKGE